MSEMVQARLADMVKEERHDLFSNLLAANDEDVEVKLLTSEVIGEILCQSFFASAQVHPLDRQYVHLPIGRPRDIGPYTRFRFRDAGTLSRQTGETV
jgi:hypothetical protein